MCSVSCLLDYVRNHCLFSNSQTLLLQALEELTMLSSPGLLRDYHLIITYPLHSGFAEEPFHRQANFFKVLLHQVLKPAQPEGFLVTNINEKYLLSEKGSLIL